MALPTRPVDDAEIATDWGQAIHDYTFAPSGCRCSGGTITLTTTPATLPIDTAIEDPGGYVSTALDRLVVPTGGEGLYAMGVIVQEITGAATTSTRVYLLVNGAQVCVATEENDGGNAVQIPLNTYATLVAGDIVTVQAAKRGTGTSPTAFISSLTVVRIGAELGA